MHKITNKKIQILNLCFESYCFRAKRAYCKAIGIITKFKLGYLMILKRKYFSVLLLLFGKLLAQEESGFSYSNYAGVNSLFVNPSFGVDSRIFIDVHLVGANIFFHNNIAYVPKGDLTYEPNKPINVLINEKDVKKKAFVKAEIIGPSAAVSWGLHSFGIFTRFRTYLDAGVSGDLAYLAIKKFDYAPYVGKDFKEKAYINTATWYETGLSYGRMLTIGNYQTLDVGASIKRLKGVNATSLSLKDFDYTVEGNRDLYIDHVEGGYRFIEPGWGIGKGWAIDLGANYQFKVRDVNGYLPNTKKNGCKNIEYKYRVGVSLMDLGAVKIKSGAIVQDLEYNAQEFDFDSIPIKSISDADRAMQTNLVNNAVTQTRGTKFTSMLPFALSAQFDYNFENGIFINASLVNTFKINNQTKRPCLFSITPRYERKLFEIAMPLSFVGYTYPQMGLCVRLGNWIIVGSDRIGSFRGKIRDVYGADIYFHLKFALFKKCRRQSAKFRAPKHCPAYSG